MNSQLVQEIAAKSAVLPFEQQREILAFVESKLQQSQPAGRKKPFRSVRGILNRTLEHLEEDLQEIRQEMWGNFPREEPK
jgi:hypothetical protein